MSDFAISIDIHAPPERVFSVMSDVEKWREWTASVTSIELIDAGPLRVGSRALIRQPKFPPALWRVTGVEDGKGFTWVSGVPGLRVTAHHWIEALPEGTRVTLSLTYRGFLRGAVIALTRKLTERYLELEARGLKARSEGVL
jgi:uncharacterized membrane protein